jgi:hypothetical protein
VLEGEMRKLPKPAPSRSNACKSHGYKEEPQLGHELNAYNCP